ncbi:MAG: hypothetical protein OEV44_00865 [Spirochaetota bacterium]|nr:hypothetical protein [Spirochaetota bacterium]
MVVGNKNTVIRAISKKLDRQLKVIQREMQKEESIKIKPKHISFIAVTSKIEVKRR